MNYDFDDTSTPVQERAAKYIDHLAERFTRVLQLAGVYPRPLARFFAANFVRYAKLGGRTRSECHRLVDALWEAQEAAERVETVGGGRPS